MLTHDVHTFKSKAQCSIPGTAVVSDASYYITCGHTRKRDDDIKICIKEIVRRYNGFKWHVKGRNKGLCEYVKGLLIGALSSANCFFY